MTEERRKEKRVQTKATVAVAVVRNLAGTHGVVPLWGGRSLCVLMRDGRIVDSVKLLTDRGAMRWLRVNGG